MHERSASPKNHRPTVSSEGRGQDLSSPLNPALCRAHLYGLLHSQCSTLFRPFSAASKLNPADLRGSAQGSARRVPLVKLHRGFTAAIWSRPSCAHQHFRPSSPAPLLRHIVGLHPLGVGAGGALLLAQSGGVGPSHPNPNQGTRLEHSNRGGSASDWASPPVPWPSWRDRLAMLVGVLCLGGMYLAANGWFAHLESLLTPSASDDPALTYALIGCLLVFAAVLAPLTLGGC